MYCKHCGTKITNDAIFCASCGLKVNDEGERLNPESNRPIAGIIVAIVLAIINLLWSSYTLINITRGDFSKIDIILNGLFPHYIVSNFIGQSALFIFSTILIIGSILSFYYHPKGNKLVKMACWLFIIYIIIFLSIDYTLITNNNNWENLSQVLKSGIMGGLIGGLIGGTLPNVLVLFLFRKFK